MSVLDFFTLDEIDDLPEDHQSAFLAVVRHAQSKLTAIVNRYDSSESGDRFDVETWQHSFMNAVIAAAKHYEIEPIASLAVPLRAKFGADDDRQFRADLDHYLMQVMLQNGAQRRRESVLVSVENKDRIRAHIHAIRSCIDGADGLSETKRSQLHQKLSEFEATLEKSRLNLFAVSRIIFEILSVSANVVALNDSPTINRLVMNIMHVVSDAKAAEDQNKQLPAPPTMKAIMPPRPATPARKSKAKEYDPDDEIPF